MLLDLLVYSDGVPRGSIAFRIDFESFFNVAIASSGVTAPAAGLRKCEGRKSDERVAGAEILLGVGFCRSGDLLCICEGSYAVS